MALAPIIKSSLAVHLLTKFHFGSHSLLSLFVNQMGYTIYKFSNIYNIICYNSLKNNEEREPKRNLVNETVLYFTRAKLTMMSSLPIQKDVNIQ